MAAKDRPFTQLATDLTQGPAGTTALNEGRCPTCRGPIIGFDDDLSRREFKISGMCQKCQDSVFNSEEY